MRIEQTRWTAQAGWDPEPPGRLGDSAQLLLLFGARATLENVDLLEHLRKRYPAAHTFGCSTAGEILGTEVTDGTLAVTAIHFAHTRVAGAGLTIESPAASYQVGARLARSLAHVDLVHVLVLSDGLHVNGTDLVRGLSDNLPHAVTVTGGLSADGEAFAETLVLWDGAAKPAQVAVLGLYGERLRVGYASLGGWDPFGPERRVTRAHGNVLYELDNRSALDLYKTYLGDQAADLPAAGLLFPLAIRPEDGGKAVVRTILAVSEQDQSLTFAGDMPEGWLAQLMKANFDRLIDGAIGAARASCEAIAGTQPELALLISCVGRKLVLKQRIEEEVEGVREVLGAATALAGFYSYGEISPFTQAGECALHNQTMTITTLAER